MEFRIVRPAEAGYHCSAWAVGLTDRIISASTLMQANHQANVDGWTKYLADHYRFTPTRDGLDPNADLILSGDLPTMMDHAARRADARSVDSPSPASSVTGNPRSSCATRPTSRAGCTGCRSAPSGGCEPFRAPKPGQTRTGWTPAWCPPCSWSLRSPSGRGSDRSAAGITMTDCLNNLSFECNAASGCGANLDLYRFTPFARTRRVDAPRRGDGRRPLGNGMATFRRMRLSRFVESADAGLFFDSCRSS